MSKGIDYGELGLLCSEGKIKLQDNIPQYIDDLETILLAYLNYKEDSGFYVKDIYKEWGTPRRHWRWFDAARKKLRATI